MLIVSAQQTDVCLAPDSFYFSFFKKQAAPDIVPGIEAATCDGEVDSGC